MDRTILIKDGNIWSAHDDFVGDIVVVNDKIVAVGENMGNYFHPDEVIDAGGLYVFPGGIDPHVHISLPFMGTMSADDYETGTLAALHGGTTTLIDFAIPEKGQTLLEGVETWHEKANGKAIGDYSFHCAVIENSPDVREQVAKIVHEEGINSFKVFMAYKNALMVDDAVLMALLEESRKQGAMVNVHAENGDVVAALIDKCKQEGNLSPKYHAVAHPAETEAEAMSRFIDLARYYDARAYIVHTTNREAMKRAYWNYLKDQRVLVETCCQYLVLDDSVYDKPGFEAAKYVMTPPIRGKDDQEALWAAIQAGHIQTIGTDHCPFNFNGQKDMGKDDFSLIPNGGPGVEHRLEIVFSEGVRKNRITMNRFVETCCTNPATIFGLETKGSITPGKDADIVIFDPFEEHTISSETHHHNVDYSLFEGMKVTGKTKTVLLNGQVVIRDGQPDEIIKGQGQFLKRKPLNETQYAF
ncbi:MAG: dihydropyrimidinase [bacterium]|nr:dihydropyrimidinase [bacterium]